MGGPGRRLSRDTFRGYRQSLGRGEMETSYGVTVRQGKWRELHTCERYVRHSRVFCEKQTSMVLVVSSLHL